MRFGWTDLLYTVIFAGVVAIFFIFGEIAGWRVAGVISLIIAIRSFKDRRGGFGWEGYEPSFYVTGWPAVALITLGILWSLFLVFFAQIFVGWF